MPFDELRRLRDAIADANHVCTRLTTSLATLERFCKAAEAEAARDQSDYLPAAHNGREGELMSEYETSPSARRTSAADQVGRHVDVLG